LMLLICPCHPGFTENGILIKPHPQQGRRSLEDHFRRCEFYCCGQECCLGTRHDWDDPIHMTRFLNSCQNSGVLRTICNQECHVPTMRHKFMCERVVATLKEHMASPSFALLGGRILARSAPTINRGAPAAAVTSLTARPAGSNARCRCCTSNGGAGTERGTPRSSNPGRSSRDRNVWALEATTETSSFDDDSSLEAADDFVVAKLNGECLGGCSVEHPPHECPNVVSDVAQQKKTFASLSSKLCSLPIRAIAATEDGDDDDVDLVDLNDPEDQCSDTDLDFP